MTSGDKCPSCSFTKKQAGALLTVVGSYLLQFSFGYSNTIGEVFFIFFYRLGNLNTHLIKHMGIYPSQSIWFLGVATIVKSLAVPVGELLSYWIPYVGLLLATVAFCRCSCLISYVFSFE